MPGSPPPPRFGVAIPAPSLPEPLEVLRRLGGRAHPFLRLVAGPGFRGRPWSFLAVDPVDVLRVQRFGARGRLDRHLAPIRSLSISRSGPRLPFAGGFAGLVGYEARSGVETRPGPRTSPLGFPQVWLGRYDAVLAWDHRRRLAFAAGLGPTRQAAERAAGRLLERAARRPRRVHVAPQTTGVTRHPRPRVTPEAFRAQVAAARRAVLRGDIFQANVSQRFDCRLGDDPVALFERLVAAQPAPYMTYVDLGDGRHVLSASPERFLRVRGRIAETDPMKGTRPRGSTRAEDDALRVELEACEKERAELAMIVDLSRNDLARVCETGSVRVTVPRRLLRFARVHQAIAVVRGRLPRDKDRVDLLQAAFPPGSVTGAPKVRAMEIIDELEGEGRGPYSGALGWFDAAGDMDLSVAIRSILLSGGRASYRVGGGITLRSKPDAEWRETLDKGRGLFKALAGREDQT